MILLLLGLGLCQAAGYADCEAGLARAPSDLEAWRCFLMVARADGSWAEARHRLRAHGGPEAETGPEVQLTLAHIHASLGEPEALAAYRAAQAGFAARPDPEGEAAALIGLANALAHQGAEEAEVAAALQRALERVADRPGLSRAAARAQLARHLWRTGGDYTRAIGLVEAAEAEAGTQAPYALRVLCAHVRAGLEANSGRTEAALASSRALVALAAGQGDRYLEATARLNLATMLLDDPRLGSVEGARAEATAAREAALAGDNPYSLAGADCLLGRVDQERAPGPAVEAWRRCQAGYAALGDPLASTWVAGGLAVALSATAPEEGLRLLADAHEEALRQRDPTEAAALSLKATALLFTLGRGPEAEAAARAHIAEVEGMSLSQSEALEAVRVEGLFGAGRALLAGHHLAAGDLDEAWLISEGRRARWLRLQQIAAGASTGTPGALASLDALQATLGPDEAVLSYQLPAPTPELPGPPPAAWLLVLTADTRHTLPLPNRNVLEGAVALYDGLLDGTPDPVAAAALYRLLLAPALDRLPPTVTRLVIVPDGPLHGLPFETLGEGDPLGETHTVDLTPSATVYLHLRALAADEAGGAVILADPTPATGAPPLPGARDEARGMLRRLRRSEARIGAAATTAALPIRPALLHIAAHAVVDRRHPGESAILLADGPLRSAAVASLDLRGAIVVLTACRGAAGESVEGEGPLGLARSFLAAGAAAVLANRWPMTDQDAVAFSDVLYAALAEGQSLSRATQSAARSLREAGAPARSWAGMALYGDGRRGLPAALVPPSSRGPALPLLVTSALAAALIAAWARRGRRAPPR